MTSLHPTGNEGGKMHKRILRSQETSPNSPNRPRRREMIAHLDRFGDL